MDTAWAWQQRQQSRPIVSLDLFTLSRRRSQSEGGVAMPIVCNVRKEEDIKAAVHSFLDRFGTLDLAVYNAGSILWNKVIETPLKKFDLLTEVNVRGAYAMICEVLPYYLQRKSGKILLVSPPIYSRFFKGKAPYAVSKMGMTILVHGLAHELKDTGVSISALWPATGIKAHVTEVLGAPDEMLREPTIFADAVLQIAEEDSDRLNGQALIDEDYLRSTGITDFSKYRCDPDKEPPRMMPRKFPTLTVDEENEAVFRPKL